MSSIPPNVKTENEIFSFDTYFMKEFQIGKLLFSAAQRLFHRHCFLPELLHIFIKSLQVNQNCTAGQDDEPCSRHHK